jgi:hypothetical protein
MGLVVVGQEQHKLDVLCDLVRNTVSRRRRRMA